MPDADADAGRPPGVLILIQNMSFTYDTRVKNIAGTLTRAGYAVSVICPRYPGDPRRSTVDGVSVRYYRNLEARSGFLGQVGEYAWSLLALGLLALRAFARRPFRYIHLCNPPDLLFVIAAPFKAVGVKVVYDMHDLCPELGAIRFGPSPLLQAVLRGLETASILFADHVLITSSVARRRLLKRGAPEGRMSLVHNGPATERTSSPPKDVARPAAFIRVGYVGNMNPQDGLETLVLAVEHIVRKLGRAEFRVTCIGGGGSLTDLRDLVRSRSLSNYIDFPGRMTPELAMEALAGCDFCVVPDPKNPFTDAALMVKAVEYVSLGKAFVAFDLEETRAVCGPAGLFVSGEGPEALAEAMVELADDPVLRSRLEEAAAQLSPTLTWAQSVPALLDAYASLADGRDLSGRGLTGPQASSSMSQ